MPSNLFTASVIRRLAREQKSDLLVLAPDDLITPEAADLARELGVRLVREAAAPAPPPVSRPKSSTGAGLPPLKVVRGAGVALEAFGAELATPGTDVRLKDVVTSGDGAPMAAGYMALERGEFPWTLNYDEVDVVLEGELVIRRGAESVRGGPGDVIYVPRGSNIVFSTPSQVRFVYVTFPADWA